MILVSRFSGEVTSYIDFSYCIHILWEVCRSVFSGPPCIGILYYRHTKSTSYFILRIKIAQDAGYTGPKTVAGHLARLVPNKDAKILDIGCGTGLVGEEVTCVMCKDFLQDVILLGPFHEDHSQLHV